MIPMIFTFYVFSVLQCGEAMSLDCQCRGELALRHRTCAEKWSRVKVLRPASVLPFLASGFLH